ncbi:unnamed protein product, partial [Owenia fusiformis]
YSGAFSLESSIDHLGPMAKTVDDCALLLEVLAGSDGFDSRQRVRDVPSFTTQIDGGVAGLKIGFVDEGFTTCEADVIKVVKATIDIFKKAGANVEETSIPLHKYGQVIWSPPTLEGAYLQGIVGANIGNKGFYPNSMMEHFKKSLKARPHDLPMTFQLVSMWGEYTKRFYQSKHYGKAQNLNLALTAAYDKSLETYDVIVMPTLPFKAPRLPNADTDLKGLLTEALNMVYNTCPFDITGHPAISLNAGSSEGLPIGIMIVGRHNDDATVLRVAKALESRLKL